MFLLVVYIKVCLGYLFTLCVYYEFKDYKDGQMF